MKTKSMELFEKFWIHHAGCGADDFCFFEGRYTCEYMQDAWEAWDHQQSKIDELQGRIDDASNKIDFWVGGKNGDAIHVAKSIGNILKGNKDEN